MDGIHDLGGREGFGPIAVRHDFTAFDEEWEARMWALSRVIRRNDWNIDWFRHLVELIEPPTYLSITYFEKWCLAIMTGLVISGAVTEEELVEGKSRTTGLPPPDPSLEDVLEEVRRLHVSFERSAPTPAQFNVGERVRTASHGAHGHTRLPAYARDRQGEIVAHRGAHVFPDRNVFGDEVAQHLYTVRFTATELWGSDANARDTINIDLWESYLARA